MANFNHPILANDPQGLNRLNENMQYLNDKTTAMQAPPFVAASETEMLALDSHDPPVAVGNTVVRTDIIGESNQFMLLALPASVLANWFQMPVATGAVASVNGFTGNVNLDATQIQNPATGQSIATALQAGDAASNEALTIANRLYTGKNLAVAFATEIAAFASVWGWIQNRIQSGNFSGLNVGDFIPLTVAGNNFSMEIAGINTYRGYGDLEVPNHIDFISLELWPGTVRWNPVNYNNGLAAQPTPFLTSEVFAFLNGLQMAVPNGTGADPATMLVDFRATGIFPQLPAELRNVIVQKRWFMPRRFTSGSLLIDTNSWDWRDGGFLWLPDEIEAYGTGIWGGSTVPNQGWDKYGAIQYPIFAGNRKIAKRIANGGSRATWMLATPGGGSSTTACVVGNNGGAHLIPTSDARRVPLCFRIA